MCAKNVSVADVHAAGEGDLSVHDEDFAMVAEIDGGHAPGLQQRRRQKFCERNFCVAQFPGDRRPRITCAGGIHQHADFHAAFLTARSQRVNELVAGRIVVENIADERNGCFCGFDGGKHGGKCLVAVDERFHFIAGRQRPFDDATDDAGEHFKMFRAVVLRFAEIVGNGAADGLMHAEFDGAAADAVDAEHEVERRPQHRHEPDDSDPKRGGAGIALAEQGMAGGERRGEQIKPGDQVRPELRQFVEPVHRRSWLPIEPESTSANVPNNTHANYFLDCLFKRFFTLCAAKAFPFIAEFFYGHFV